MMIAAFYFLNQQDKLTHYTKKYYKTSYVHLT